VAGSQFAPYGVRVVFDAAEWGGLCKHIVAALLAYSHEPMSVRELPELEETLSGLEREELKDYLRQSTSYLPMGKVDVFLHENLVGDAIAAVEGDPFGGLVARVADAAIESHPEWVIETCRRQAEEIMNQGRSKDYDEAVDWLEKVQDSHLAAGREEEWVAIPRGAHRPPPAQVQAAADARGLEVAPGSTRCRSSLLRNALAAIILRPSPAAILLAGDCTESARGVGDARPEGDRIVDATSR
jgi:hypothetical protein